jgi:hypothetical protein
MLVTLNTPKVQVPFGVFLLHDKFDDMDTKARSIYCHNIKKSEVKYGDKTMTNSISQSG